MESIEDFAQKAPRQLKDRFFLKEVRIVIIDFPTFDKFRKEFMRRYQVYRLDMVNPEPNFPEPRDIR